MANRTIIQNVPATRLQEGAGFTVYRTLGTPAQRHWDPFLMLDQFQSDNPDEYIAGFPEHPHRGFVTLTYMLDGHMQHRDSLGNTGDLRAGGAQWMKAASGILHSEQPQQTDGLMRGFQLWINLPAREKMSRPEYQEFAAAAIPVIEQTQGVRVKLLSGAYAGQQGPIVDPYTELQYLDVSLAAGATFQHPLHEAWAAFIYVFEGHAQIAGQNLPQHALALLGTGTGIAVQAGDAGARFLLVAGRPIGEPIVQGGPFVMNSQAEIEQAMRAYRDGTLVRAPQA